MSPVIVIVTTVGLIVLSALFVVIGIALMADQLGKAWAFALASVAVGIRQEHDAKRLHHQRLLADLKEELTLLASLQEEHLFPVLRRHGMHPRNLSTSIHP